MKCKNFPTLEKRSLTLFILQMYILKTEKKLHTRDKIQSIEKSIVYCFVYIFGQNLDEFVLVGYESSFCSYIK